MIARKLLVRGCSSDGLLDCSAATDALLGHVAVLSVAGPDMNTLREAAIDRLADAVAAHLDTDRLLAWLGLTGGEAC